MGAFPLLRRRRLTPAEQNAFDRFLLMDMGEVRARAEEFERAATQYAEWLELRSSRGGPLERDELDGYAPEMQYGDPAGRWRALERTLRGRGAWQVEELGEREALRWARRVNALSTRFARPEQHRLGGGA